MAGEEALGMYGYGEKQYHSIMLWAFAEFYWELLSQKHLLNQFYLKFNTNK
ncbi:MAG: hypothetical protein FWF73_00400 [Spirochaetes bacterium]|nr:hypothetical protein [Spirochaetota bacterium]